jgi:hypothetical protein
LCRKWSEKNWEIRRDGERDNAALVFLSSAPRSTLFSLPLRARFSIIFSISSFIDTWKDEMTLLNIQICNKSTGWYESAFLFLLFWSQISKAERWKRRQHLLSFSPLLSFDYSGLDGSNYRLEDLYRWIQIVRSNNSSSFVEFSSRQPVDQPRSLESDSCQSNICSGPGPHICYLTKWVLFNCSTQQISLNIYCYIRKVLEFVRVGRWKVFNCSNNPNARWGNKRDEVSIYCFD